ncbi:MAG: c-type cytochrome biogenesis protein CcmI [Paracoccaceae bacterium]
MQAMAGWEFWAVAGCLAVVVVALLVAAMRRVPVQVADSAASDLAVYRDQLAEIERDLARNTIGPDEAARLRAEIGKRVIEADRARSAEPAAGTSTAPYRLSLWLILGLIIPGTLAVYWGLGAPGYPDMALGSRLAELDAGIAGRPAQEAELATLGRARDAALDQRLQAELTAQSDPEALRDRFRQAFEAGRMQEAVRVQERLLVVLGDAAGSNDQANLALALVAEAEGYVSPEAEAALRASLQADMSNELSRYLVGEMFLQGGRFDQAFRFWRPIAEDGAPGSPWVASIRERIGQVAELAGIRYALPEGAAGPTAEDMAAAGEMSPEERQAMIEGMVAQLSDRLATEGGDVEDWNRLIRSLAVLERLPEAQAIYDEAKAKFEGRPAELSFLRLAAVETGLNP